MAQSCSSLKEALLAVFATQLEVTAVDNGCIVTLPLKTVDDRYIDVFVDRVPGSDLVYVHDGGKSTAELFTQGVHATETQDSLLNGIARSQGAYFQNGRFQIPCPTDAAVQVAVFAIAQCASLAMIEVLSHLPKVEDEPLAMRVGRSLKQWQPSYVEIRRRVPVAGNMSEHSFDFVSMTVKRGTRNVAIKLLPPSVGPWWQAQRYGFLVYDLGKREAAKWQRLAIISKVEDWAPGALDLVRNLSTDMIELETEHEEKIETILPRKMTELTEAA